MSVDVSYTTDRRDCIEVLPEPEQIDLIEVSTTQCLSVSPDLMTLEMWGYSS